jgi:hypothetical protein
MLSFCNLPTFTVDCGVPDELLKKAADWRIKQADDWHTTLESEILGKSEKCAKILTLAGMVVPEPRGVLPGHPAAVTAELKEIDVLAQVLQERPARVKAKAKRAAVDETPQKAPKRPIGQRPGSA